jgi:hypothetical protein
MAKIWIGRSLKKYILPFMAGEFSPETITAQFNKIGE